MTEDMKKGAKPGPISAREEYELEHLARKFGLHVRLAKAGHAGEREAPHDTDEQPGQVKKTVA